MNLPVCMQGPGHYLGQPQTLDLMECDYVYPDLADRSTPKEWEELGKPVLLDKAVEKTREIIDNHFPDHISGQKDAKIREMLDIKLPRTAMRAQLS
tara:strand:- start:460 stop:747 length:288 start_codon:yes stop_codon:yes gene_type:complete